MAGGAGLNKTIQDRIQIYDIPTDVWSIQPGVLLNSPLADVGSWITNDSKLLVFGGTTCNAAKFTDTNKIYLDNEQVGLLPVPCFVGASVIVNDNFVIAKIGYKKNK